MDFSVGEILSGAARMMRQRFWPLVGLWAIYFGLLMLAYFVFAVSMMGSLISGGMAGLMAGEGSLLDMGFGFIVMMAAFYVFYLALALAQIASLCTHASSLHEPGFAQSFSAGWRSVLPLMGASIVLIIGYVAAFGLLSLFGNLLGDTLGGLLIVLGIVAAIYLSCRLSMLVPIAAIEGVRSPIGLITASWEMTRAKVLGIFLTLLVYVIALAVLIAVLVLPFTAILANGAGEGSAGMIGLMVLLLLVASVLIWISQSALLAALHARISSYGNGAQVAETFS